MKKDARILIVGHNDLVEHALYDHFRKQGYKNLVSAGPEKWDVFNQRQVEMFFDKIKPQYLFLSSTKSGSIQANQKYGAEFIYANLMSQCHMIHKAWQSKVKKVLFIASSCVYPKSCPQPMTEERLLTGVLEPTSEPYAIAKLAGIKMCQAYRRQYGFDAISMIPATLYGLPGKEDMASAHVLNALVEKFTKAVQENAAKVTLWGSGRPRREFLFADDFARACEFLMKRSIQEDVINVGSCEDISIKQLARLIAKIAGYKGSIEFNTSQPDGALRKLLDSSKMTRLGFKPQTKLQEGLTYILNSAR